MLSSNIAGPLNHHPSSPDHCQAGRAAANLPIIISLILLGAITAMLWVPVQQEQEVTARETTTTPDGGSSLIEQTSSNSTDTSGTTVRSPLDDLTPEMRQVREELDALFRGMQWDKALDASTAHRVARARDDLQAYLDTLGPEHVPMLVGLLEEDPEFINRRFLMKTLGRIGSEEALTGLVDHYHWSAGKNKESEVKHTVDALASAKNDLSFEILCEYSLSEETSQHRYRFLGALSDHPRAPDASGIFSDLLTDPTHFRVRQRAAYGLKVIGSLGHAPRIEDALLNEPNPYVRQSYLGALGGIRDVRSVPLLSRILQEDDVLSTRVSAVKALLRIEGDAVLNALVAAREDDSQPQRVREEVIRALSSLGYDG